MNDHGFDKRYWEAHWTTGPVAGHDLPANPHLVGETAHLSPGTALDAGCGTGAEALWLAERGWQVTGADISRTALAAAVQRSRAGPNGDSVEWIETDAATWEPGRLWDLVVTNYAHPSIPQLDFYRRIAAWTAPGGTLLIVGHLHAHGPASHHPAEATVAVEDITALFDPGEWAVDTARERTREVTAPGGATATLHDAVVRVHRRS